MILISKGKRANGQWQGDVLFSVPCVFIGGETCLGDQVLKTALSVLVSLPPLSLSSETSLPPVAIQSLDDVSSFLCSILSNTQDPTISLESNIHSTF